jgi:hypothetical protein
MYQRGGCLQLYILRQFRSRDLTLLLEHLNKPLDVIMVSDLLHHIKNQTNPEGQPSTYDLKPVRLELEHPTKDGGDENFSCSSEGVDGDGKCLED